MASPVQNTEIGLAALFICVTVLVLMFWGDPSLLEAIKTSIVSCK